MRAQGPAVIAQTGPTRAPAVTVPQVPAPPTAVPQPAAVAQLTAQPAVHLRHSREPDSYVTPATVAQAPTLVPPTELANYIVAHSAFSATADAAQPALSTLMSGDSAVPPAAPNPIASDGRDGANDPGSERCASR